jgi:hypothetical protein
MFRTESYLTMGSLEIFKSLQVEFGHDIEFGVPAPAAIQTEAEYAYIQRRVLEPLSGLHGGPLIHPGSTNDRAGPQPALLGCLYVPQSASRSRRQRGHYERGGTEGYIL